MSAEIARPMRSTDHDSTEVTSPPSHEMESWSTAAVSPKISTRPSNSRLIDVTWPPASVLLKPTRST
jgi:hypothetical protein